MFIMAQRKSPPENKISKTDLLALERTKLANERTFLAYFRSFLVFFSSGVAIIKIPELQSIHPLGYALLIISPFFLFIGMYRFYRERKKLKHFYDDFPSSKKKRGERLQ